MARIANLFELWFTFGIIESVERLESTTRDDINGGVEEWLANCHLIHLWHVIRLEDILLSDGHKRKVCIL